VGQPQLRLHLAALEGLGFHCLLLKYQAKELIGSLEQLLKLLRQLGLENLGCLGNLVGLEHQ
jgi:hypothetical protein